MWETLKPKREGWAAKSLLRSVDFPVPEGPEKTMGRAVDGSICVVGGMVVEVRVERYLTCVELMILVVYRW